jgi:hypothetical protein
MWHGSQDIRIQKADCSNWVRLSAASATLLGYHKKPWQMPQGLTDLTWEKLSAANAT